MYLTGSCLWTTLRDSCFTVQQQRADGPILIGLVDFNIFLLIKEMVTKRKISAADLQSVWHFLSPKMKPQVLFLKLFHILSYWNQLTSWSHYAIRQIHALSAQSIFYFQAFSIRLVECVDRSRFCSSPAWTESPFRRKMVYQSQSSTILSPESSSLLLLSIF